MIKWVLRTHCLLARFLGAWTRAGLQLTQFVLVLVRLHEQKQWKQSGSPGQRLLVVWRRKTFSPHAPAGGHQAQTAPLEVLPGAITRW
ncbi:hypothetical protein CI102_6873 [Trichoderma harzianum]|nr:hypothetical protein CI102_6873 [Trichoderma harzianum]